MKKLSFSLIFIGIMASMSLFFVPEGNAMFNRGCCGRMANRDARDKQREENRERAIEQGLDSQELREMWKQRDEAREKRRSMGMGRRPMGRGFCGLRGRGRNCCFN